MMKEAFEAVVPPVVAGASEKDESVFGIKGDGWQEFDWVSEDVYARIQRHATCGVYVIGSCEGVYGTGHCLSLSGQPEQGGGMMA